jgi:hypothetical protein
MVSNVGYSKNALGAHNAQILRIKHCNGIVVFSATDCGTDGSALSNHPNAGQWGGETWPSDA